MNTQLLGTRLRVLLSFHPLVLSFPRGQWSASIKPIGIWDTPRNSLPTPRGRWFCNSWVASAVTKQLCSLDAIPSRMGRRSCCRSGPGSRLLWEAPLSYPHLQDEIRLSGPREGWVSHREILSILCDAHTPTLTPLAHPSAKPLVTLCSAVG